MKHKHDVQVWSFVVALMVLPMLIVEKSSDYITDAKIVDANGKTINLAYQDSYLSYTDNVGTNADVKLRVYATASGKLSGKWVGLAYKVGDVARVISDGPTSGETLLEPLGQEFFSNALYYAETSPSFSPHDAKAVYPGILYAVISDDPHKETNSDAFYILPNDVFVKLDPSEDGWLVGDDGSGYGSGDNSGEDSEHGSYSLNISQTSDTVLVTVNYASSSAFSIPCKFEGGCAIISEIPVDRDFVIVGISKNGTILDSKLTSPKCDYSGGGWDTDADDSDDTVTFNIANQSGTLDIIVNGIKEAEVEASPETRKNYEAKLISVADGSVVTLEYQSTNISYVDSGGNPDVKLRVYSNTPGLRGKWVGLFYKFGTTLGVISKGIATSTLLETLGQEYQNGTEYYAETSNEFALLSSKAVYPGVLYAVISDVSHPETLNGSFVPDASDVFIELNPEEDGWLKGYDGTGLWSGDNLGEDATHGSYALDVSISGDNIYATVNWVSHKARITLSRDVYLTYASAINVDENLVVVSLVTQDGEVLDSKITSISQDYSALGVDDDPNDADDTVTLDKGTYTGTLYVYANGIREAVVTPKQSVSLDLFSGWNLISVPYIY